MPKLPYFLRSAPTPSFLEDLWASKGWTNINITYTFFAPECIALPNSINEDKSRQGGMTEDGLLVQHFGL